MYRTLPVVIFVVACASESPPLSETIQPVSQACGFAVAQWDHGELPQQTGRFTLEFSAWPQDQNGFPIDAVIGLSDQRADSFDDLAVAVRFNDTGRIDVRNGGGYAADVDFPYDTAENDEDPNIYWFRLDVDIPNHRYSAWVHRTGGAEVQIANNYAFRTEQASVTRLGLINAFRDSPETGWAFFCDTKITPSVCSTSAGGWANTAFPAQTGQFFVEFDVTPSANNIDAIIGMAAGPASHYTDLGPIVRFNPDGTFDARDGDGYRAVMTATYQAGVRYNFGLTIDVANHTYLASVWQPGGNYPGFAWDFAFRTEQADATSLDSLAVKADTGSITVCDLLQGNFPF
jgi:unsaturated chondroitin disaccharide hydrolase